MLYFPCALLVMDKWMNCPGDLSEVKIAFRLRWSSIALSLSASIFREVAVVRSFPLWNADSSHIIPNIVDHRCLSFAMAFGQVDGQNCNPIWMIICTYGSWYQFQALTYGILVTWIDVGRSTCYNQLIGKRYADALNEWVYVSLFIYSYINRWCSSSIDSHGIMHDYILCRTEQSWTKVENRVTSNMMYKW